MLVAQGCLLFFFKVRRSLEQIRVFTEHKDALAQGIQDENDQLKEQLGQLISSQGGFYSGQEPKRKWHFKKSI